MLEAIGAAGYAGTDLGPPGYLGEGDVLRERLAAAGLELVGGFVPMRFSERDGCAEDTAGLHHTLDLFDAAGDEGRRGRCCATRAGPSGSRTRAAAARTPSLRLDDAPLADARGRRRARGGRGARARLRAGLPPPHLDLRRGAAGDRALPRGHRRGAAARLRAPAVAGGDPVAALRDWRERIGAVHIKDVRLDVLERRQGGARRHADRLAARAVLRARRRRRRPRRLLRRARRGAATTAGSWSSRTACSSDAGAFAGARAEQRRNREWLREHAGW